MRVKDYPELIGGKGTSPDGIVGLVLFDNRLLLINARQILTSANTGPSRGTFIFGRFLDEKENKNLTDTAGYKIEIHILETKSTEQETKLLNYALLGIGSRSITNPFPSQCQFCHFINPGSPSLGEKPTDLIIPINENLLGGFTILSDIHNHPAAILSIQFSREIEKLETNYSVTFMLIFIGLTTIMSFFGANVIARTIKNEEALDRDYQLLRTVIDNVPDQIFAHDVNGRFFLNNQSDAHISGVKNPVEMLGKKIADYYPIELAKELKELEQAVIQTGEPVVDHEASFIQDGKLRWVLINKAPLRDNTGEITGIVVFTRDITKRKRRERELEAIVIMSRVLRSAETSNDLLIMIYDQIIELLKVDYGTLELIDPVSGDAEIVYSYGFEKSLKGSRIPTNAGLNKIIRSSKKPYLNNSITEPPGLLKDLLENGSAAVAGAPLIADEVLIGFLWVGRKTTISEDEVQLLAAIADIAASSIRRLTLHEMMETSLNQLTSLRKIDTSINNNKDLDITFGVLLDETITQLKADAAIVLMFHVQDGLLENKYTKGFTTNSFKNHSIHLVDGPAGLAAQKREIVQIRNLLDLGPTHRLAIAAQKEGFVSYFAVPLLVHQSEIKGVLEVYFRKEYIPDLAWINFLEILAGQAAIAMEQVQLFTSLQNSNDELVKAYDQTIEGWVRALDLRDKETEGHSLRVMQLCVDLAVKMGINEDQLIHFRRGALLHDIGKVGVPDAILLKPGKLSEEEWAVMRGHPQFGYDMLSPISYLRPALDIPYCHHEKWDGSGYPRGLKGDEIPMAARIFCVVDVWDALSNVRPYRQAWTKENVVKYLKAQSGFYFDPGVVEAFLEMIE